MNVRASWSRLWIVVLSLAGYACAVSGPVVGWNTAPDATEHVMVHVLQYVAVLVTGVLLGMAAGPWFERGLVALLQALQPQWTEAQQRVRLRAIAYSIIGLSLIPSFLWVVSALNLFVDLHRGLAVEADVLIYLMGVLVGGSWVVLLRKSAWFGLLLSPAMTLMVLSNVLVRHTWA